MRTVLITGGAGFIGSHLALKLLALGYRVKVLDCLSPQIHGADWVIPEWLSSRAEFIHGSVTSLPDLEQAVAGVEGIVHLAAETGTAQSMYEIARYNEVNTQGTALLFQALQNVEHKVSRVVLASSRSIYGEGAYLSPDAGGTRVTPASRCAEQLALHRWEPVCPLTGGRLELLGTREDDAVAPASIYAATKYAQEDLVRIGASSLGIGYAILRLQNVYGEGQSLKNPYTGILSIFSTKIRNGSVLPLFEDGEESRDFVHVSDVVEAMFASLTAPQAPNTTINVGSGVATSVRIVAEQLTRAFGRDPQVEVTHQYRVGDIRHNRADISRLEQVLGLKPEVSLSDGLERFARWVNEQPLPEDLLDRANQELIERKLMG